MYFRNFDIISISFKIRKPHTIFQLFCFKMLGSIHIFITDTKLSTYFEATVIKTDPMEFTSVFTD